MVTASEKPLLHGIAQMLVMEDLLDQDQAEQALEQARIKKIPYVEYLVEQKILGAQTIALAGAKDFGVPLFDLNSLDKEFIPINLVSEPLIRKHHALPIFRRGEHLYIAVADPSKQIILDEIKFHTGLHTHGVVVEADKLTATIEDAFSQKENAALDKFLGDTDLDDLDISSIDDTAERDEKNKESTDDAPVVRFVHKILLDAINKGASDIHFEPYERNFRVRFRIDGILYEVAAPPINLANRISSRLKVMSRLDISERRVPQDGRFKMTLSRKHSIDFRVSTCPTVNGEKVVMRILDPTSASLGVEALGMSDIQRDQFMKTIVEPQGMILVTGPTGSGKTVTLYTALSILNTEDRNISTAEDPVEIKVPGINQVAINVKTGLTFASALRSFLRQDPDVIMVGEMRDLETAEIGIKAAQTGHMVLSTLHTNSAPETLTRLFNMGVPAFNIAATVSLIIAQRLARRLCDHCKEPIKLPEEILLKQGFAPDSLSSLKLFKAVGCEHCTHGYKGRTGLYEVLPVSKEIGRIIMTGGTSLDILQQAKQEGMITIREAGIDKVGKGIISLEEINRVTKD